MSIEQAALYIENNNVEGLQALINSDLDVNAEHGDNSSLLYYAVEMGNLNCIKLLVENRADINFEHQGYITPLTRALDLRKQEIFEYLYSLGGRVCTRKNFETNCRENKNVSEVVDVKNCNCRCFEGCTPLIWAVRNNCENNISYILSLGPDLNLQDRTGKSALHWACNKGFCDIAEILIENKANINLQDNFGDTPLHLAVRKCCLSTVTKMLEKGADKTIINKDGDKPLDLLVPKREIIKAQIIDLLRE